MKQYLALLAIMPLLLAGLLVQPAGAADLARLEAQVAAVAAQSGASGLETRVVPRQTFNYGVVIPHYVVGGMSPVALEGTGWWLGLAVTNLSDQESEYLIGTLDKNGIVAGSGTFTLVGNALRADFAEDFITSGVTPDQGRIAIFSDNDFKVDRYSGNLEERFRSWIFEGEPY